MEGVLYVQDMRASWEKIHSRRLNVAKIEYIYNTVIKVNVSRDRPRWPKGFRVG